MTARCLVPTKEIIDLSQELDQLVPVIRANVGLWLVDNKKGMDEYPSAAELAPYIEKNRREDRSKYGEKLTENITLIEHDEGGKWGESYRARTIKNAQSADITIAFAYDYNSPGEILTRKHASKKSYVTGPMEVVDFFSRESIIKNATRIAEKVISEINRKQLDKNNLKINIAGNTISKFTEGVSQKDLQGLIENVFKILTEKDITISEVISGGQSGADIAGAFAADNLDIKTTIRAPRNFLISTPDGKTKVGRDNYLEEIGFKDKINPINYKDKTSKDFFESTRVTNVQEDKNLSMTYTPMDIKNRTNMLSKMFSDIVTRELEKKKKDLKGTINVLTKKGLHEEAKPFNTELNNLTRSRIIDILSPREIFKTIHREFYDYMSMTMEDRIQYEFRVLRADPRAAKISDERLMQSSIKRANLKSKEFNKILENFNALASIASNKLAISEKLVFKPNGRTAVEFSYREALEDQASDLENKDAIGQEEANKESWMSDYKHISARESLSESVRATINSVPRLNHKNQVVRDDLGYIQYLDADYVHATLIDALRHMTSSKDMMPLLEKLSETKSWLKPLILELEKDNLLFSQFYQNYRKDFINYSVVIKRKNSGGYFTLETKNINSPESMSYLLDEWRDNYEAAMQLTEKSIYNRDGSMNLEVADENFKKVVKLLNETNNLTPQELAEYLTPEKLTEINNLLKGLGISLEQDLLALVAPEKTNISVDKNNTVTILKSMNVIYKGVKDGKVEIKEREDGSPYTEDLMRLYSGAYGNLAKLFGRVKEDAIESSVRENGKSYYSHVIPCHLTKTIKRLKNVLGDDARFAEYIEHEFGKYEWFKKDGKFLHHWLELLTDPKKGKEFRSLLDHKVVLNYDKKEYSEWTDKDYEAIILAEYTSDPKENSAWYYAPIFSDAPSAEFIKFTRYSRNKKHLVDGKTTTYDNFIVDKLTNLVQQEYDRIMTVRERFNKNKNGAGLKTINNYDIKTDLDGNITSMGGAEFKFLPALNNYQVKGYPATDSDTSIIRFLSERGKTKEGRVTLKQELREILHEVMELSFEEEYSKLQEHGLLDSEEGSKKYALLDSVNQEDAKKTLTGTIESVKHLLSSETLKEANFLLNRLNNNKPITTKHINEILDSIRTELVEAILEDDSLSNAIKNSVHRLQYNNPGKDLLREFHYNNTLAQSQIIQLATTDLAFYESLEEFQKRFKQEHSPSMRLNTEAMYKGEKVGREYERAITVQDQYLVSNTYENLVEVLLEKVDQGFLSDLEMMDLLGKYSANNVSDGQSFRTLSSYRRVMVMQGDWNDAKENAYKNFINNTWDISDFDVIWQTKKPFVYTQISKLDGSGKEIKVPIQHKNSEFLLMALAPYMTGEMAKSGKLRAINTWMEANEVDVMHFDSVVKVGLQGVINLNTKEPSAPTTIEVKGNKIEFASTDKLQTELAKLMAENKITLEDYNEAFDPYRVESFEDTMKILTETTKLNNTNNLDPKIELGDPDIIHEIPYEDYGIQTSTPEHIFDKLQAMGTQIRKLITADISPDAIISINGKEYKPIYDKDTKEIIQSSSLQIINEYNNLITENIIESFNEVKNRFETKESIEKILMEELESSDRYGDDLKQACKLVEQTVYNEQGEPSVEKVFNLPLYEPVQSIRIQQLLYSVIKSTITKQRFKGGSAIQVTSYGMDKNLKIKYSKDSAGKTRIEYIECMMPWYTERLFESFMKKGSHVIDINKIPEELKKLIGYRVPTEDKYSMVPLYIKGFTPRQNGSVIMLPTEITTISGADFDIDKLYILMPEFDIQKYDTKRMKLDFKKLYNEMHSDESDIITDLLGVDQIDASWKEEWEVFKENNREKYLLDEPIIKKVLYDTSKSILENNRRQRNNRILDIMWGILTSSDTTSKILKGGNFDYQKRASRIVTLLENLSESEIKKLFGTNNLTDAINKTKSMSLKELNKLAEEHIPERNPLSMSNLIYLHQQNMVGKLLIGVYANHNAHHAIAQLGEFSVMPMINLNGKTLTNLSALLNDEKYYISNLIAGYLSASVDNAKDPVLLALNQNGTTANAAMLLVRLGYNPIEVGLLFKQPTIMELTSDMKKDNLSLLEAYKKRREVLTSFLYSSKVPYNYLYGHNDPITTEELASSITLKTEMDKVGPENITNQKQKAIDFALTQLKVLDVYIEIYTNGELLGDIVSAHRSDTSKGAIGPTLGHTLVKYFKILDMLHDQLREDYPFRGLNLINFKKDSVEGVREAINRNQTDVPYMLAFYSLGIKAALKLMEKYFPTFGENFIDTIDIIRKFTQTDYLDAATINGIINEILAYYMTLTEFFGKEKDISAFDKRKMFLEEFPSYYDNFISKPENASIAKLPFFQQLKTITPGKYNPIEALVFKNVGKLSKEKRDAFMRDWESLLYMKNPSARKLAVDLARYYFYRNGFGFGPNNAIHLIPTNVKLAIPEYREALSRLGKENITSELLKFIRQYMRNHLGNRRLVKYTNLDHSNYLLDENGNIKDVVYINPRDTANILLQEIKKKQTTINEFPYIIPRNYFAAEINDQIAYFEYVDTDINGPLIFAKINPLGYKNNALEYEWGVDASLMETAITPRQHKEIDSKYANTEVGEFYGHQYDDAYSESNSFDILEALNRESALIVDSKSYDLSKYHSTPKKDANDKETC